MLPSRRALSIPLLAAALSAPALAAQEARLPLDPKVTVGTLPNGLRYYIRPNGRPEKRAELRLAVNAGSVLEDEDQRGLAHFVEHMAFNGTASFPKQEIVRFLESVGMRLGPDLNAYTSFDETVYLLQVPTDSAPVLDQAVRILAEWARAVTFDPVEVDKERGVVIEEWRGRRGASARIQDKIFPVLLRGSRYAERLPIGDPAVLERAPRDRLARFYADWYRPDLMAVVAVGDFDPARVEALIRRHFGPIPAAKGARPRPSFPVPLPDAPRVAIATDPEQTTSSAQILFLSPRRDPGTESAFREGIVERLYHGMLNRRLAELARRPDPPFVSAFSLTTGAGRGVEGVALSAETRPDAILRGFAALATEAERAARHGFTASELEREKREALRSVESAYAERERTESAVYAARAVAHFLEGEPDPGIEYVLARYRELLPGITLEEVNRFARGRLAGRAPALVVIAPEKEGVRVPTEAELLAALDSVRRSAIEPYAEAAVATTLVERPPRPGAVVAERTIPELGVTEWTLSNGARVVLKPTDFKADEVVFRAFSPGGTSLAPDADYVPAATAAEVVAAGGVGRFGASELEKALAGKVVRMSPAIGELEESLSGGGSPRDLETLFQLVHLYFTAPREDSAAFASLRTRLRAQVENRAASPQAAFLDTLLVTLTQGHPRARPPSPEYYERMDLRRSLAFYRDRFGDAGDFTFLLVGSFELAAVRPLVETYLASLPTRGRKESWRDVGVRPPEGVVEKTVRKGIEPVSLTQLVFTGPAEYAPERAYVIRSLADLLRIRLRETLREEMGGTYGVAVGGGLERDPTPRYFFTIGFGAAPDRLEELTRALFAELDTLAARGPAPADLERVKEIQRRERETNLKQNTFWASALAGAYRLGRDPREILAFDRWVAALTPEAVRDAARAYLRRDRYIRVSLYPEKPPAGR